MKIHKSKKGFIAGAIVDFYAYIVFILIIIIFVALFFMITGCDSKQKITSEDILVERTYMDADYLVLNFLKTNTYQEGIRYENIADLIVQSKELDYYDQLEERIDLFFNKNYEDYWHIHITYPDDTKKEFGHSHILNLLEQTALGLGKTIIAPFTSLKSLTAVVVFPMAIPLIQTGAIIDMVENIGNMNQIKRYYYLPNQNNNIIKIEFAYWGINSFPIFSSVE